jgi:hypothetical protein
VVVCVGSGNSSNIDGVVRLVGCCVMSFVTEIGERF